MLSNIAELVSTDPRFSTLLAAVGAAGRRIERKIERWIHRKIDKLDRKQLDNQSDRKTDKLQDKPLDDKKTYKMCRILQSFPTQFSPI